MSIKKVEMVLGALARDFQVVFFKDVISLEVYIPRIPKIQKGKYEPVRNMCQLFFSFSKLAYFTIVYLSLFLR